MAVVKVRAGLRTEEPRRGHPGWGCPVRPVRRGPLDPAGRGSCLGATRRRRRPHGAVPWWCGVASAL